MPKSRLKELGYIDIFRQFNKKKIKYIVCGGVAVNLLGIPRMTYDIDLILKMEAGNLKKFLELLKKWNFKPRMPVNMEDFMSEEKRKKWMKEKNMRAFCFYNPEWSISEIDVLINIPLNYDGAVEQAAYKRIENVRVPVVSARHLIKMKKNTKRKQDGADIRYLRKLL